MKYLYLLLTVAIVSVSNIFLNSQSCYSPISGYGVELAYNDGTGELLDLDLLQSGNNLNNVIDGDLNTSGSFGSLVSSESEQSFIVRDTINTFSSGTYTGWVLSDHLLTTDILSDVSLVTYLDGVEQESILLSSLTSNSLLSLGDKFIFTYETTSDYDEVRLEFTGLSISVLGSVEVFTALSFKSDCGIDENNVRCDDQIAGETNTIALSNSDLVCVGCTVSNADSIIDGDKNSAGTWTLVLNALGSEARLSVIDHKNVYPAESEAGFVIELPTELLTADLIENLTVRTYLFGQVQDEATYNGSSGTSLLSLEALGSSEGKMRVSLPTTVPFNQVEIGIESIADINTQNIQVYYAFEEPLSCSEDCQDELLESNGHEVSSGVTPLLGSIANPEHVVNSNLEDSARLNVLIGILGEIGTAWVQVERDDGLCYDASTRGGFLVKKNDGLLNLGLLDNVSLEFRDSTGSVVHTKNYPSLLSAGVLSLGQNRYFIYDDPNVRWNSVRVELSAVVGVLNTMDVFYAYSSTDADNDGTFDCNDYCPMEVDSIDVDGDGIPDNCDCTGIGLASLDFDADGVKDDCDVDADNDGIPDYIEDYNGDGNPLNDDADGDGIPNFHDLDSDNDGIPDLIEGRTDYADIAALDADMDGVIDPGSIDVLTGGNTINTISSVPDTDGDITPDYLDLDTDNDGILDTWENGFITADPNRVGLIIDADTDNDGIPNNSLIDSNSTRGSNLGAADFVDSDGDNVPNFRDLDSDNDGVYDLKEYSSELPDTDGNGIVDGTDDDEDGVINISELDNNFYFGCNVDDPDELPDTDGDGVENHIDLDSDNDGLSDLWEAGNGEYDDDGDGMVGNSNTLTDTDNDGIPEVFDDMPMNYGGPTLNETPTDTDNDSIPDMYELDSDDDGIYDINYAGLDSLDTNDDGVIDIGTSDSDNDGVFDSVDNNDGEFGNIGPPRINASLRLKAFLGGVYDENTGLMRDDLRTLPDFPLTEPYSALGGKFNPVTDGGSNIDPNLLNSTGDSAIVDWVYIELRSGSDSTNIIATQAALILRNGTVTDTAGSPIIKFNTVTPDYYMVSLKHRNHLGAMLASEPYLSSAGNVIFNFSDTTANAYDLGESISGIDYTGQSMDIIDGVRVLWPGDANHDGLIKYQGPNNDASEVLSEVLNYTSNINGLFNFSSADGYYNGDIDMNGNVRYQGSNNDTNLILNVVLNFPLNINGLFNYDNFIAQLPQ